MDSLRENAPASAPPRRARAPVQRLRSILEPFGVDARSAFPLGEHTCVERDCMRRALRGELVCPVHYGLATPEEMPDYLADAAARGRRVVRTVLTAAGLALLGAALGIFVDDPRFGWVGGGAAGLVLTAGVCRELQFHRLAAAFGLFGFLLATILAVAGTLVATIAALPWILGRLI